MSTCLRRVIFRYSSIFSIDRCTLLGFMVSQNTSKSDMRSNLRTEIPYQTLNWTKLPFQMWAMITYFPEDPFNSFTFLSLLYFVLHSWTGSPTANCTTTSWKEGAPARLVVGPGTVELVDLVHLSPSLQAQNYLVANIAQAPGHIGQSCKSSETWRHEVS